MTRDQAKILQLTVESPFALFDLVQITNKQGISVDFDLHPEQVEIVNTYMETTGQHLAVLKSRQVGASTLFAALMFWEWWRSPGATEHVFYIHVHNKAKKFAKQWRHMYKSLPKFLRELRPLQGDKLEELCLRDTGALLSIATAGGHGGARSASVTTAVCSEYPFWASDTEKTKDILSTISGSLVPGGRVVIESTANRYGDPLHELFETTNKRYHCYFSDWSKHPEYSTEPPPGWRADPSFLPANHESLTRNQLHWYQGKREELGTSRMKREFPCSVIEAYDVSADMFIQAEDLKNLIVDYDAHTELWIPATESKGPYAAGADGAYGVGKDYSCLVIVDCKTMQPVLRYRNNRISPKAFAMKIEELCAPYNPLLLVESNQPGDQILEYLRENTKARLWMNPESGKDFTTSASTKPKILQHLKDLILQQEIKQVDLILAKDLHTMYTDGDKIITPRNEYGHCDTAMAAALAWWSARDVPLPRIYNPQRYAIEQMLRR